MLLIKAWLSVVLHSYSTPEFQNFVWYMVITLYKLKISMRLLLLFHSKISKLYQPTNWNFFELVIQLNSFLEIGKNHVSIIITIISNITLLVLHNVICFAMSHGVNKKAPPIATPHPSSLADFYQVCLLFYRKQSINILLLWSDSCKK